MFSMVRQSALYTPWQVNFTDPYNLRMIVTFHVVALFYQSSTDGKILFDAIDATEQTIFIQLLYSS